MLNALQITRLDEDIRRLLVEIGRRDSGQLEHDGESCKGFAEAVRILVDIKRNNRLDTTNEVTF